MSLWGNCTGYVDPQLKKKAMVWFTMAMLLLAACGQVHAADPYPSTLITGAMIFDGEGGWLDDASLLFADGKIVTLGQNIAALADARAIDDRGKWVTPGIIDVHSHI